MKKNNFVKRIITTLMGLTMVITLAGCGGQSVSLNKKSADTWVKGAIAEVGSGLLQLAQDGLYVEALVSSGDVSNQISAWADADYDFDGSSFQGDIYRAEISGEDVWDFLEQSQGEIEQLHDLSDFARDYMTKTMIGRLPSMYVSRMGSTALAASSVATYGKNYIVNSQIPSQICLVPSEDGVCMCFVITQSEEGIVSVSASFIPCYDIEDVRDFFKEYCGVRLKKMD